MKGNTIALGLAAAALALTACGGNATPTTATPSTPAQVAAKIGATGVTPMDPTLYATAEASATWHGRTVDIAVFQTNKLRDNWEAVARTFVPILADGPDYAVAGD